MDDPSDTVLLSRISSGEIAAMKVLYERHAPAMQAFARRLVGDDFAAADVVQEAMLSAWRSAARFEGRSGVRTWLFSLARNKAVDRIRKDQRLSLGEPDETIPDDSPNPEAALGAVGDARQVRECVSKLSGSHREVIHLAFFEDLSYPQVAETLGLAVGTVKTRIFHAKKLLMRCLSQAGLQN